MEKISGVFNVVSEVTVRRLQRSGELTGLDQATFSVKSETNDYLRVNVYGDLATRVIHQQLEVGDAVELNGVQQMEKGVTRVSGLVRKIG